MARRVPPFCPTRLVLAALVAALLFALAPERALLLLPASLRPPRAAVASAGGGLGGGVSAAAAAAAAAAGGFVDAGPGGSWSAHSCSMQWMGAGRRRCVLHNMCAAPPRAGGASAELVYFAPERSAEAELLPVSTDVRGRSTYVGDDSEGMLYLTTRDVGLIDPQARPGSGTWAWTPTLVTGRSAEEWARSLGRRIAWHRQPLLFLRKLACANLGHCLLETLYPLFSDIEAFLAPLCADLGCDPFDTHVLLMERRNGSDCGCADDPTADWPECGTARERALCERNSAWLLNTVSRRAPIYLNEIDAALGGAGEVVHCWPYAVAGHGGLGPYSDSKHWHHNAASFRALRNRIYASLGLGVSGSTRVGGVGGVGGGSAAPAPLSARAERQRRLREQRVLRVLVNSKDTGRRRFLGLGSFSALINNTSAEVLGRAYTFEVRRVAWEQLPTFREQTALLAWADIYVSASGGGGITGLLLSDDTAMVSSLHCGTTFDSCTTFEFELVHANMPHYAFFAHWLESDSETAVNPDPVLAREGLDTLVQTERLRLRLLQAARHVVAKATAYGAIGALSRGT
jgi:hypothetical protein